MTPNPSGETSRGAGWRLRLRPLLAVGIMGLLPGCGLSTSGLGDVDSGLASGGSVGTGGRTSSGGNVGSGGAVGSAGTSGSGGIGTGGRGMGGAMASGGRTGSGGAASGGRGSGGTGGRGTGGGTGGQSPCNMACTVGRTCCGTSCVNVQNDPFNCGACGRRCEGSDSYCASGTCQQPPCSGVQLCNQNSTCCGSSCCPAGDLCCDSQGPVSGFPTCHHPTALAPTCPTGCAPLCVSDRNVKRDISAIDPKDILAKVNRLPISTWSYINEPAGVRHLGPMAQDFYASFGLGDSDRSYHSVDGHGVALAAIQALDRLLQAERERIKILERENHAMTKRIEALEKNASARIARGR